MAKTEAEISKAKIAGYEALGIEGVVTDLLKKSGQDGFDEKDPAIWLRAERKRLQLSQNLRFWIPQAVAIVAVAIAIIAVMSD